jgi:hypothetical protein
VSKPYTVTVFRDGRVTDTMIQAAGMVLSMGVPPEVRALGEDASDVWLLSSIYAAMIEAAPDYSETPQEDEFRLTRERMKHS